MRSEAFMERDPVTWKVGGVSVTGFSHIDDDTPCQDAHKFRIKDDGTLVAAIADGAGSARHSHVGAKAFVDTVVNDLCALPSMSEFQTDVLAKKLAESVNATKEQLVRHGGKLAEDEDTVDIADFHATLLVVVTNGSNGAFFHVGDGAACGYTRGGNDTNLTMTRPHNGEYANETYFVTQDNWEENFRVTPFVESHDSILLMSDGVTPMGMLQNCTAPAFEKFVNPIVGYIEKNDNEVAHAAVTATLSREEIRSITGDDKTFLWAIRQSD